MNYDLELDRIVKEIKKKKARNIYIQLPDGLKPMAKEIADYIKNKTGANVFIHLESCFGYCDIPDVRNLNIDLLIQFGHNEFPPIRQRMK